MIIFRVIVSLNNNTPKNNAVMGSKAPSIAVFVAPIYLIAYVIVLREIIVGIKANPNMQANENQLFKG